MQSRQHWKHTRFCSRYDRTIKVREKSEVKRLRISCSSQRGKGKSGGSPLCPFPCGDDVDIYHSLRSGTRPPNVTTKFGSRIEQSNLRICRFAPPWRCSRHGRWGRLGDGHFSTPSPISTNLEIGESWGGRLGNDEVVKDAERSTVVERIRKQIS